MCVRVAAVTVYASLLPFPVSHVFLINAPKLVYFCCLFSSFLNVRSVPSSKKNSNKKSVYMHICFWCRYIGLCVGERERALVNMSVFASNHTSNHKVKDRKLPSTENKQGTR